ncbi:hypothetical protein BC830DRAFT_1095475, partial [Chytriomyces sp. MP71]
VGNFEKLHWSASGSAGHLLQPFLDNVVGHKHQTGVEHKLLPLETVLKIVKDAFNGATERDIYTGDFVEIFVITKDGVTVEKHALKKD